MLVLELYAGTRSIGKAFESHGHEVMSVDWDERFEDIDLRADIGKLTREDVIGLCGRVPDVIWMSPDCTTYSVAALSRHRKLVDGRLEPQTDYARQCDATNRHTRSLLMDLDPPLWFIENPRACMRKMDFMAGLPRYTVCYCQYGDSRMKPTDIWTNHPDPRFRPPCNYGDPCHERAPRGSRCGTQGLKGHVERAVIPPRFCEHIVAISEDFIEGRCGRDLRIDSWAPGIPKITGEAR